MRLSRENNSYRYKKSQSMLHALLTILVAVFAKVNGAQTSRTTSIMNIINCTVGMTYNKECSTTCNHAYGKCNNQASNRNDTLSRYACSQVQGQCMKDCYATAREMCDTSVTPATPSKSDADKTDDSQNINKGSKSSHIGVSVGMIIVIGVVVYILMKRKYKRSNDQGNIDIEYHQVLDQEMRDDDEGGALENQPIVANIPTTEARVIAEPSDGNSFNEGTSSILPSGGSEMILSINGNITATAF